MASTEIDLITGFLGAGKTTFIRRYVECLRENGMSCAVIENEFGAAGVDTAMLEDDDIEVREISGGCVCCTQKVNFYEYMCDLAGKVDRVIVEPSGIFRADDFMDMLRSPTLRDKAHAGMLVCVVDPDMPGSDSPAAGVLRDELAYAGCAYISRCDVADAEDIANARARLEAMGIDRERIFAKPLDMLTLADYERMSGALPKKRRFVVSDVAHTTAFQSTTLRPEREFTREETVALLEALRDEACGHVLRAKGRLKSAHGSFVINMTPGAMSIEECTAHEAFVNVIGERLNRRAIGALFSK